MTDPVGNSSEANPEGVTTTRPTLSILKILNLIGRPEIFGVIVFLFVTTFPPLEVTTDVNLSAHMLQHVLIATSGVFIGFPLYRRGKLNRYRSSKFGFTGLLIIGALLVFWHLPNSWDAAVANVYVHIIEHICFLIIGFLIGTALPMLQDNFKLITIVLAISAHMFYGFSLFLISTPVYPLYPAAQQQTLGLFLFAPSPAYLIGYLYLSLTRESRRLEAIEGKTRKKNIAFQKFTNIILPTLSLLMIIILASYFGITAGIISGAANQANVRSSVVYIDESPVYWQYSPQTIHVVIGVNNTVIWISHSFTEDTVTSKSGLFTSQSIPPGGTFSYTFIQPGTYQYYCLYHVWMQGTIIVTES